MQMSTSKAVSSQDQQQAPAISDSQMTGRKDEVIISLIGLGCDMQCIAISRILLHPSKGAEYCEDLVCVSLSVCVCLSAWIFLESHDRSTHFLRVSSVPMARSYSVNTAWMTSLFLIMGHIVASRGCLQ